VVHDGLWEDILVVIVEFEGMLGGEVQVITSMENAKENKNNNYLNSSLNNNQ
jgi:hypothetical protein